MNGRALNEKAVEVSPSSSRVLDRAAEVLTPFPPSKNRPRPGDWTCPSCGFSNFQRRTACFRCSYPSVGGGPGGDGLSYGGYGYNGPHMMGPHHHMGHHGGHGMGHGGRMGGSGGSMVPFRAGDWKCGNEGCGYHNFAKNVSCLRCNASRAGAAVVADSSFAGGMDNSAGYGMGPPGPMGGTAGPNHFGPPHAGYNSGAFGGAGGYPAHNAYSGMANAPGHPGPPGGWPPMNAPVHAPSSAGQSGGFDSRATEAAFSSAANAAPTSQGQGPSYGSAYGGMDSSADPFAFLNAGMGALGMGDEPRRNGANAAKSPTS